MNCAAVTYTPISFKVFRKTILATEIAEVEYIPLLAPDPTLGELITLTL